MESLMFVTQSATQLREARLGAVFEISKPSYDERRFIDGLGYWATRMSGGSWTIRRERLRSIHWESMT
jgi:hypothetical protein